MKEATTKQLRPGLPGRRVRGNQPRPVRCQICRAETNPGLDVGPQPIGDLLLTRRQLNQPETFYPLQLHHCGECGLTQLSYLVNPKIVYKNFPFVSGTTRTATEHLQSLPRDLVARLDLDASSFAIDIGSNDGTLLKAYRPFGVRFLGVDPAGDPVRVANEQGIETLHTFFDLEAARFILRERGSADAITACGVFGHIRDLDGVMSGVKKLLSRGGIFATDNQYWLPMLQRGHYDNIFHQHLRYYSLKPLMRLHRDYDLEVFDVERSEVYGGSFRVFAGHSGVHEVTERVRDLLELEEQQGLYEPETGGAFTRAIEKRRLDFVGELHRRRLQGQKVIGVGAPAKASTVCNYCRVGPELVEYITEVNPLRIGMYLPGVRIPIVEEEKMFRDRRPPDAAVLFAWNYHDEIVPKLRQRGFVGDLIQP